MVKIQHISDLIASLPTTLISSNLELSRNMRGQTVQKCIKILEIEYKHQLAYYESFSNNIDKNLYDKEVETGVKKTHIHELIRLLIDFCKLNEWNELNEVVTFLNVLHNNRWYLDDFNNTLNTIQSDSEKIIFINWIALNEKIEFWGGIYKPLTIEDLYDENDFLNLIDENEELAIQLRIKAGYAKHKEAIVFFNSILDDYKSKRELIAPEPVAPQETKPQRPPKEPASFKSYFIKPEYIDLFFKALKDGKRLTESNLLIQYGKTYNSDIVAIVEVLHEYGYIKNPSKRDRKLFAEKLTGEKQAQSSHLEKTNIDETIKQKYQKIIKPIKDINN